MTEEDSLPSKCYQCDKEIVADGLSVLQKCTCLVTLCHTCALKQLIDRSGTYNSYLQCLICGTHTEANSGLFMNLDLVEACENLLIDRAFVACGTNKPRKTSQNCQRYLPLLEKYANMGLEKFATNVNTSDLSVLRLHIARMEWLRGGKPEEMADPFLGEDEQDIEDADELPMGPLAYLRFSHNLILEKIVALPETCEELDLNCNTCGCTLTSGSSTLSGCACVSLVCSPCAPKTVIQNRETYKEGYKCITCRSFYKVTFEGYDLVDAAISDMLIGALQAYCHKAGKKYKYKTFKDYALLIDDYWNAQYVPPTYYLDTAAASTEQLRLEVARLEDYRRMKLRSLPNFKAEELPDGPLNFLKCNINPFLEVYIRHTKLEPEMDLADVDWSKYQYTVKTADEFRAMQNEQQSQTKDSYNPKANDSGDENDPFRFLPLFRRQSTPCKHPNCTVNPYSQRYLSRHLKVIHGVSEKTFSSAQKLTQHAVVDNEAASAVSGQVLPKIRKQPENFPWHAEEPRIREVQLPLEPTHPLGDSPTPKRLHKSKADGGIEDDLVSLESDHDDDELNQTALTKYLPASDKASNSTGSSSSGVIPMTPIHSPPAKSTAVAVRNVAMDILSDDSSDEEQLMLRKHSTAAAITPSSSGIDKVDDAGILDIDSDTDDEDIAGNSATNKVDEEEPVRFIGVIGHKPEGGNAIGSSFAIANATIRRAPPPPTSGDSDKGVYFKILEGIKFAEQYEITVELPKQRNSIFDCDMGKFGSFRVNYQIVLAKADQKLLQDAKGIDKPEINGVLELFTNKTQLSTIKAALTTQVGFSAIIVKIRTADGRVLQSTRSLSYYHLKENSTVKIAPVEVEIKRPVRPMVYHRKKASRPTHYELAVKYAEQRRMRLEQEKAEMERVSQLYNKPATGPSAALPVSSGIEAAESKEADEDAPPILDVPLFRPPLNSYERALMEVDSESEDERRKKIKQQPPRPIVGHFKREREMERPASLPSQPLFKSKAAVEIPVVKLQPRDALNPDHLPVDANPWNLNSASNTTVPPPPPSLPPPATNTHRALTSYERALMEDSNDSDDSDYKRKKKKASNQPKQKAGAPLARYNAPSAPQFSAYSSSSSQSNKYSSNKSSSSSAEPTTKSSASSSSRAPDRSRSSSAGQSSDHYRSNSNGNKSSNSNSDRYRSDYNNRSSTQRHSYDNNSYHRSYDNNYDNNYHDSGSSYDRYDNQYYNYYNNNNSSSSNAGYQSSSYSQGHDYRDYNYNQGYANTQTNTAAASSTSSSSCSDAKATTNDPAPQPDAK